MLTTGFDPRLLSLDWWRRIDSWRYGNLWSGLLCLGLLDGDGNVGVKLLGCLIGLWSI